ncbi:MAG: hypothetical protein ACW98X_15325 [Promethearchaeota archaeon]
MSETDKRWQRSILDEIIQEFPSKWIDVNPKHPAWKDRVKLEIEKIMQYINFLRNTKNRPWFKLLLK